MDSHFCDCIFKNCRFHNIFLRKCEFWNSIFQNCEILDCDILKAEFTEHTFKNSQFNKVDLGWSHFVDCEFRDTELHDINFKATIINGSKTQNTTGSDLHFNKKFLMYFWKSNHCIKITDSISFEKFLKDMT